MCTNNKTRANISKKLELVRLKHLFTTNLFRMTS